MPNGVHEEAGESVGYALNDFSNFIEIRAKMAVASQLHVRAVLHR